MTPQRPSGPRPEGQVLFDSVGKLCYTVQKTKGRLPMKRCFIFAAGSYYGLREAPAGGIV